jgi:hypothetical protein
VVIVTPEQLSVAVAVAKLGAIEQSIVDTAGNGSITGAISSITVIVCVELLVLLQLSVALQVLVIT